MDMIAVAVAVRGVVWVRVRGRKCAEGRAKVREAVG